MLCMWRSHELTAVGPLILFSCGQLESHIVQLWLNSIRCCVPWGELTSTSDFSAYDTLLRPVTSLPNDLTNITQLWRLVAQTHTIEEHKRKILGKRAWRTSITHWLQIREGILFILVLNHKWLGFEHVTNLTARITPEHILDLSTLQISQRDF